MQSLKHGFSQIYGAKKSKVQVLPMLDKKGDYFSCDPDGNGTVNSANCELIISDSCLSSDSLFLESIEFKEEEEQTVLKGILKKPEQEETRKKNRQFCFNETVLVGETWSCDDYERKGDLKIHLTPTMAYLIRQELNQFKREMQVHDESKKFTHFYN